MKGQTRGLRDLDRTQPKHIAFRELLLRGITEERQWPPGTRIPAERALQERYGISRNTIRQAIGDLVGAGYLFREVGRGTFVNSHSAWGASRAPAKAKLIALIITDVTHDFGKKIAKGAEEYLHQCGYSLVLCQDKYDAQRALRYVRTLIDSDVRGIILDPVLSENYQDDNSRILEMLRAKSIPAVLVDRDIPGSGASRVFTDNEEVACSAARYLIRMGHTSIAVVRSGGSIMDLRFNGILRAYREDHVPEIALREVRLTLTNHLPRDMSLLADALAIPLQCATAVISLSEYLGLITYRAFVQLGKAVPRDISFITFDHPEDCFFEEHKITYVEQPALRMGERAARTLVELIETGPNMTSSISLKSRLVIGKSVLQGSIPAAQRARV